MGGIRDKWQALVEADRNGDVAYARLLCEELLAEDPDHGPALVLYASLLTDLGLYETASDVLQRAGVVVPEERRYRVVLRRGVLLQRQGDFVGAERAFLEAHALQPDDATYLIYAGSAAFARGDHERAIEHARAATECSEGCVDEAFFNLGGYLLAQKRYAEARDCYRSALAIDPDYEIARQRLDDVERVLERRPDTLG